MSSSYYRALSDERKKSYYDKLCFNGFELPDPLDDNIRDIVFNSMRWPTISIFDIFSYLVVKHKMYTKLAFQNHTYLPCYNYVSSEKVKNLKCYRNNIGVCIVAAEVEASQTAKKIHLPWIVAKFDGEIISGHCTCMAGLGETCSHVGATLFFIEKILREEREKPACTSKPCKWNKTSTNVEPSPVIDINFTNPKKGRTKKGKAKPVQIVEDIPPVASDTQFKTFLQNVKTALPSAALFTVLSDSEDTDTGDEEVLKNNSDEVSPSSILTFYEKVRNFLESFPEKNSLSEKRKIFERMFILSTTDKEEIENSTKNDNLKWQAERKGRITASNFGRVLKCKNSYESILLDIMGHENGIHTEAIAWGKTKEKSVQDKFYQIVSPLHVNLCIQSTGLFIDKDEPYLGATPDGLVTCDCCEDHIIEIKCPFIHREKYICEIKNESFFLNENRILKENHNYYEQIQGQMAISGTSKCYFVTFTNKELHYQTVEFDDLKWERSKNILKNFFYAVIFPEIVDDNIGKGLEAAAKECICKSKRSVTFIRCSQCVKTFHRSCVTMRKKSPWSCNECKIKASN